MRLRLWIVIFLLSGSIWGTEQTWAAPKRPLTVSATPAKVTAFFLPEVTAVAIPPVRNPACPEGRLVFASGVDLARTNLDGTAVAGIGSSQIWLTPTIGETDPHPIFDNHMVGMPDGSLIHTVEGITWSDIPGRKPAWWSQSVESPVKNSPGRPGARGAIWVFRSTNCGSTWTLAGKVDAATLAVEDPATGKPVGARCGTLRLRRLCKDTSLRDRTLLKLCPQEAAQIKLAEAGGWDGHYLAVDPDTSRLVISTPCYFGTGINTEGSMQILAVSDDLGQTWTSSVSLAQATWRGPVAPVGDGKWGFVWYDGSSIRLAIDDPVTGTFSKSTAVAPFTDVAAAVKDTYILNTNIPGAMDLAINPTPVGSFKPSPGAPAQPLMRNIIQVSSPTWSSSTNAMNFQVHNLDPTSGAVKAAARRIESSVSGQSVLLGTFLQGHRASLFYWLEEVGPGTYRVRYQVYNRGKALLLNKLGLQAPGTIQKEGGGVYDFTTTAETAHGDYMKGSHFLEPGGVERFFLFWNDKGNVAWAEVRVSNLPPDDDGLPKRP